MTGEVESVPDSSNDFVDPDEYEEIYDKIDCSDEYVRLPSQYELNEYNIMENFAEDKDDEDLIRVLRGRKPFRRFKDTAIQSGKIDDYYRYRTDAFAEIAREWCRDNDIPYTE